MIAGEDHLRDGISIAAPHDMRTPLPIRVLASWALAGLTLAACGSDDASDPGDTSSEAAPFDPSGTYALSTRAELSVAAAAPGTVGDAFLWLRQLRTKPAAALAAAADAAGVPAVEALYAALPRPLEDRLDGWIDGHLLSSQAGGVSFTHRIDQIIAIGERVLGEFGLDTSLLLLGQEATHTLVAVRFFPPPPLDVVVIPRLDPPDAVPSASARLTSQLRVTGSRAHTLTLGPHDFTLPYGRYAWPAFNKSLHAASGSELAALMAMTIDCAAMAEAVATKCVGPACVGHREELRGVCEGGRDRIVADLQARVEQSGFDMIAIKRGTAVVTDSGGQSMSDGVWTMAVNTGSGLRPVPGVFSGAKVAAVPGLR